MKLNKEDKLIIIPDEHMRGLYKKIKHLIGNGYKVIWLGDYFDSYPFENLSDEEGIANFEEIIDIKKTHPDDVMLLLGNHDLGPYICPNMTGCRTVRKYKTDIIEMFKSNLDLFDIGWHTKINGKKFTFSHSCILNGWVNSIHDLCKFDNIDDPLKDCDTPDKIIDKLNELLHSDLDMLSRLLNMVSRSRGGYYWYGSPVWAHWDEINEIGWEYDGYYQIFGHSQQMSEDMIFEIYQNGSTDKLADPIIRETFACLDCKQIFTINNEGKPELLNIPEKV